MQASTDLGGKEYCAIRFPKLWRQFGSSADVRIPMFWKGLETRYGEKHRHYHTFEHIKFCLEVFERFKYLAHRPSMVEVAIFYHDAVYDVDRPEPQNEERSAGMAVHFLDHREQQPEEMIIVKNLILATKHDPKRTLIDNDEQLIVDIDLAGLGAPWEVFLKNNRNVRAEYAHVPEEKFREVNGKSSDSFLIAGRSTIIRPSTGCTASRQKKI